jgi:hypothetical protein
MHKRAYSAWFFLVAGLLLLCACLTATVALVVSPPCFATIDSGTLPEINDYKVTPSGIDWSSSAIISWDVKNAVSVNIDQGIGEVPPAGQAAVSPRYSTTYKLTAANSVGTRTRFITLDVVIPRQEQSAVEMVNADPVTGRSASVDMRWEDYCCSGAYQVQVARDPLFTLKVYDSGMLQPADSTAPAFWLPPGALEAGHAYYWRVRTTQAATGQRIASPWSDAMPLAVRPGYAVSTPSYGLQSLSPANGAIGCPVGNLALSWSGYQGTTKYRIILAKDARLQNIVVEDFTTTTAYALKVKLDYDTAYFWQASAVDPVPGDAGSVFTFSTESVPVAKSTASSTAENVPGWAIAVIVTGALLTVIVTIAAFRAGKKI